MKPFLSFCVILILFQTLIFGSLVKIEFPGNNQKQWGETLIHNQVVLDPFLIPGKEGIDQSLQHKNEWVPFQYNKTFTFRNNAVVPLASSILFSHRLKYNHTTIPAFILNGTLRI